MFTAELGGTPWTYDRQIPGAKGDQLQHYYYILI